MTTTERDHVAEFDRAWADPGCTRIEVPAVDVNRVLAGRYRTGRPLTFTTAMCWDMELRKAWHPDLYIPGVVAAGSATAWGRHTVDGRVETFRRASQQRLWLTPGEHALVLEDVHVDPGTQIVTFLGADRLADPYGNILQAGTGQPVFHVQHSVGGTAGQPLNQWRIVHLTKQPDERLRQRFLTSQQAWLPEFLEIYIRSDLGIELTRRETD